MSRGWKRGLLCAGLTGLYLAGLVLGTYIVNFYPLRGQRDHYVQQAAAIALEFPQGQEDVLQKMIGANMHILIYDEQGNNLRHEEPVNRSGEEDSLTYLEPYITRVLNGETVTRYCTTVSQFQKFDINLVVGVPMAGGGAVILARNLVDLPTAIVVYLCYFTGFYWLAVFCILSVNHRKQKLDELRQTYLDNTTHALKTPVASIKALAETLCDAVEPNPDRQRLYCSMILREANRQDHMIREAMELSKLQNQGMDLSKQRMTGDALFRPVVEKYADLFDYSEITLHVSQELLDADGLYTNARCVQQLTGVLLDNTLKFVPEGGDVWLEIEVSGKRAVICARDNGVGIDADILPHVFDRFFKGSHDFNASGSGLGLAIAKEIAQALGEKIWVKSVNGEGAAFYFTIRLK